LPLASPPRKPLTAPPSWLPLLEPEEGDEAAGGGPRHGREKRPGEGWPPIETVEYLTKLIILIVLLMGLPWLVTKLITDPDQVMRHAAARAGTGA
jgi:hypothetical protein